MAFVQVALAMDCDVVSTSACHVFRNALLPLRAMMAPRVTLTAVELAGLAAKRVIVMSTLKTGPGNRRGVGAPSDACNITSTLAPTTRVTIRPAMVTSWRLLLCAANAGAGVPIQLCLSCHVTTI